MKSTFNQRMWLAGLVVAILLLPASSESGTVPSQGGWLEELKGFVVAQQGAALVKGESTMFEIYLDQLHVVQRAYENGDQERTYAAMNRFMDMLESRDGGISAKAADAIWDHCYRVTPPALHDVKRHQQWWDKTVNWDEFFWGDG
ncbi:MAG: hypothetical protein AB7G48_01660 [Nitrospiraceae bacterium]